VSKYDYNIIVIGGGSAGLVSSYIASAVKAKVALIEKHKMGGDCLNTGCVPSKALIRSAKMISYAKRAAEFGFIENKIAFNFSDVMNRVKRTINEIEPHDSVERYSKLGVECISGTAQIISPHEVEVDGKTLSARSIIIASGSRPFIPPVPGLQDIDYLTSANLWELEELPQKLLVLGGGAIGCELAQAFSRFGSSVTIVEMTQQLLSREDEDVGHALKDKFVKEGIKVLTNSKAKSFKEGRLVCESEGKDLEVTFDKVLVAVGRKANTQGFGLEQLGINLTEQNTINANPFLQTNIPSIYVCGDVAGPYQFTHTAALQAWYAAVNSLFSPFKKFKVDYRVIPWAVFTDPEIARVGLSEKEANSLGISFDKTLFDISDLDRAIIDGEANGFVKILTEPGKDKILGVTILGHHAADVIPEYILAMKNRIGLNKILGTIHIYPTLSEANKFAAGEWKKSHIPKLTMKLLEKFHTWRRQ